MADVQDSTVLNALESGVERLATAVMAGSGDASTWRAGLEALLNSAAACCIPTVSRTAVELMVELTGAGGADRDSMESALIRLQAELQAADQYGAAPANMALAQDPELLADFIVEARDHLATAESHMLALEQEDNKPDAIHAIFRAYHTIKGLAGFLELAEIREVAHEIETILDCARNNRLTIDPVVTDAVLAGTDFLRRWLGFLEASPGAEPDGELRVIAPYIARLRALAPSETPSDVPAAVIASTDEIPPHAIGEPRQAGAETKVATEKSNKSRAVKVDTDKLDYLVDMVGEMVIAQSLVRHDPAARAPQIARNLAQLGRITDEVQRTAMAMRMIPLEGLFQRMSRLVRDLGRKSGKKAQLDLYGEDVELDRNIVEELGDPLMHMIRNAMDHGIEMPDAREAAGKPPVAKIELKAFHQAGQIVIQVSDDGRGLDESRIVAKARAKGILADGASLSEKEVINLIFEPGFSTAEQVSDISGRGVGMDVVRKQIQKLRGTIDVQSTAGRGTEFSLRLPLTMAIIDGLVVTVGAERFIVPIFSVKELLRPTPDMISTIEGNAEVVLVRNKLLPMVRLYQRFNMSSDVRDPSDGVLVISDGDGRPFAMLVDQVLGKQEVVIKNLGRLFQDVQGIAGGAILGDGRVGLIVDLQQVFA
jgi:two-component system chemotaxis sensor kinase CheA